MVKKRIYIESSVVSYLTANISKDFIKTAKQMQTHVWWAGREKYDLFVSKMVIDEIIKGDRQAARLRAKAVSAIPILSDDPEIDPIVEMFLKTKTVPERFREDAYHIAFAAFHRIDYLLTWNQKHIANPQKRGQIETVIESFLLTPPLILTPEQLLEIENAGT